MPRAALDETLKSAGQVDQFEALKLQTGEWARLLIVDDDNAWWEWVHALRAPVLDDSEMPIIIDKPRKDGSTYPDYSMRFVGQRICLGDPAVVEDKGMDPERCPACASAARGVKGMSPERRFAVPVIRYKTRDNSKKSGGPVDLITPPQAEILVWKLSQRMFNMLMDCKGEIRELLEIPDGQKFNLRAADIVVYCEDGGFQRVVFKAPKRPAYRADAAVAALVKALWGEVDNRPTDAQLKAACGRGSTTGEDREYMVIDVETTEHAWRQAERYGKDGTRRADTGEAPVSGGDGRPLEQQLDDLLGDDPLAGHPGGMAEFAPRAEAVRAADPLAQDADDRAAAASAADDIFGEADPAVGTTREPARAAAPVADPLADDLGPAAAPAAASNGSGKVQSFDDILA
jgi:hypothetical protein